MHGQPPPRSGLAWFSPAGSFGVKLNLKPLTSQPDAKESLQRILRLPAVLQATGLARSTVYRMMAEHTFPAPVKLNKRAVGWRHDDVRQWANSRPTTSR